MLWAFIPQKHLSLTFQNFKTVSQLLRCPNSHYRDGYWRVHPGEGEGKIVEKTQILVAE